MATEMYRVTGMTCGGCARHVERALRSVEGVTGVVVDLPGGSVSVDGTAPFAVLAASVAAAGYEMIVPA